MKTIHIIQHVPFEGPGNIEKWTKSRGYQLTYSRLWKKEAFAKIDEFDWLIILGGPMSIYDEANYPWLASEKQFIRSAIQAKKIVLGICLGAQLIANVLGARVYPNLKKEIGWFSVYLEPKKSPLLQHLPKSFMAFHWHGDTFELPDGATHLAYSEVCQNQAFEVEGRVVGLQFHLESTAETVGLLTDHCGEELVIGETVQDADTMLNQKDLFKPLSNYLTSILNQLDNYR